MKTYVLIHGSFQGGWIWQLTAACLRAEGNRVYTPTLEGCGERRVTLRAGITVSSVAEELSQMLYYEDLQDVVLVGTSSGGLVVEKLATLASERIERLVFLDALVPQPGENVADIVQRPPNATPYEMTEFTRGPSRDALANDLFAELSGEMKTWAIDRATPHPLGLSNQQPGELDPFWERDWNATVISCRNSANPPETHQRRTAERLRARWIEMEAGHYPMLTHPEETSRLLASENR